MNINHIKKAVNKVIKISNTKLLIFNKKYFILFFKIKRIIMSNKNNKNNQNKDNWKYLYNEKEIKIIYTSDKIPSFVIINKKQLNNILLHFLCICSHIIQNF